MRLRATTCSAVLLAIAVLLGAGAPQADAHPLLIQATPTPGLVASAAPARIVLAFTEPAVVRGSHVQVTRIDGHQVAVGPVRGQDGRRTLSATIPKLAAGVYTVRWSALGDDGHVVNGSFGFGVPGKDGSAPPGVEKLRGTAGGGRGGEHAAGEGFARVLVRWLGILAASVLFAGFLLLARMRGRHGRALLVAAPALWGLVALAALGGVFSGASEGASGSLDFGLLTAGATGIAELVRAGLVAIFSVLLLTARSRRALVYPLAGAAVLVSYGLSGHALAEPTAWSLLDLGVHVLAAGLWLGGVVALALAGAGDWLLRRRAALDAEEDDDAGAVPAPVEPFPLGEGVRAFAAIAAPALGLAVLTGVLAAVREVHGWYFLRWSDYGRVVIAKAIVVVLVSAFGAFTFLRGRAGRPSARLLRVEAVGVVALLTIAAALAGLAQGRGQPKPAERGTLFAGPAFATALLPKANASVVLAPARAGRNVVSVSVAPEQPVPRRARVHLTCGCGAPDVDAPLRTRGARAVAATVDVPRDGTWFAYVTVDGHRAPPVPVQVGLPKAPGSSPRQVLAVADLSGADADRCRAHLIGLQMAIARINAADGVDDGQKLATLVLDSGGTAAGAGAAAATGLAQHPVASAGTCGTGGEAAVAAVARAGVPAIVGDPSVAPVKADTVFRLAADPYAQGVAFGQLVIQRILPSSVPGVHAVRAAVADPRLLAGLKAGLRTGTGATLQVLHPGSLARLSPDRLTAVVRNDRTAALVLDAPAADADAQAIAALGRTAGRRIAPAPILASERVLSEALVRQAGIFGRIGAVQGVSEVSTATTDAELYQQAVPLLFRGDLASLDGLRGYVTGLALRDALRDGSGRGAIVGHLRKPSVFSNALLAPWNPQQPWAGGPAVVALQPQFLAPTLIPSSAGGEAQDSTYFPQGSWTVTSQQALGFIR